MSRRRRAPASSLDLLLDTICNTFGGVLFIAILVVLLLQMSGQSGANSAIDAEKQQQFLESQSQLEELRARLKTLRAVAAQQESLASDLAAQAPRELVDQFRDWRTRRDSLNDQHLKELAELSKEQAESNDLAVKHAALDEALADRHSKLAALEATLSAEAAAHSEEARLPSQHATDKQEIPLLLFGGKVCFVYRTEADGSIAFNGDEFSMTGAQREVAPLAGKGVALGVGGENAEIAERLKQFAKDEYYVAAFVWSNSFREFKQLKETLVHHGFEYRLVPVAASDKVYMGVSSKTPVKVQ
jgi:hypothetical protein